MGVWYLILHNIDAGCMQSRRLQEQLAYLDIDGSFDSVTNLLTNALEQSTHAHVIAVIPTDDPHHTQRIHGRRQSV